MQIHTFTQKSPTKVLYRRGVQKSPTKEPYRKALHIGTMQIHTFTPTYTHSHMHILIQTCILVGARAKSSAAKEPYHSRKRPKKEPY